MAEEHPSTQTPFAEWAEAFGKPNATLVFSQSRKWILLPQRISQEARSSTAQTSNGRILREAAEAPRVHVASKRIAERFSMVRKLEGRIIKRTAEAFWAELRENPSDFPPIQAEFDIDALPESDRALATDGTPIVWTVGVEIEHGTHRQQSIVYIRRISPPSLAEVEISREQVEDRMRGIAWE